MAQNGLPTFLPDVRYGNTTAHAVRYLGVIFVLGRPSLTWESLASPVLGMAALPPAGHLPGEKHHVAVTEGSQYSLTNLGPRA